LEHAALVLAHDEWPGGVIGIVASRLVERHVRPVLLITSPSGELARGSARSIPGVNITAAIAVNQEVLASFGGHPMAAGFALQRDRIPEFRQRLSQTVAEMISEAHIEPTLSIDAHLPFSELSMELVSDLERLAPFGPGNPNLVLVSHDLQLVDHISLGRTDEHLQIVIEDDQGNSQKAIWWGGGIEGLPDWLTSGVPFDLAYTVRSKDYRGVQELQIEWLEARPRMGSSIEVTARKRKVEVHDFRGAKQPLSVLKEFYDPQRMLVWAEADAHSKLIEVGVDAYDRYSLHQERELVIWTSPPSIQNLRAALEIVEPGIVHLFAIDPGMDRLEDFLRRLSGLVKYALRANQGQVSKSALAAGTAQQEITVKLGIGWLVSRGHTALLSEEGDELRLVEGDQVEKAELESLTDDLKSLLVETIAFRSYYSRADGRLLINPEDSP
jgi:single-stranded-DNA-specific exonuclease